MDFDDYPGLEDAIVDSLSLTRAGLQAHNDFLEVMANGTSEQISAHLAASFYPSLSSRSPSQPRRNCTPITRRKSIFDKNRTK